MPKNTLSDLFCALQEFHLNLPKKACTLLQTAKIAANVKNIKGGEYIHFSILTHLRTITTTLNNNVSNTFGLQINVDGLPLYKSSALQLWPIFGKVSFEEESFVIGIFVAIASLWIWSSICLTLCRDTMGTFGVSLCQESHDFF